MGFFCVTDKNTGRAEVSSFNTMTFYRNSFHHFFDDKILQATAYKRTILGFSVPSMFLLKLKFLRVLHVENSTINNFSMAISECIHLRHLILRNCVSVRLPPSIGKLLYLQTIDLRRTILESIVPESLWNIASLKHVYLSGGFYPTRNGKQKELRTFHLETSSFNYFRSSASAIVKFLGQMTQLVTFVLDFSRTDIPVEMIKMLANMPDAVEILLRRFDVLDKLPGSTLFPQCLRQLDLFANVIKEDPMPIVEKLPCLVVLSLSGYQGRTMSCSAQGFPRLQRLDLSVFYTEEWIIETGALPRLSFGSSLV